MLYSSWIYIVKKVYISFNLSRSFSFDLLLDKIFALYDYISTFFIEFFFSIIN